MSEPINKMRMTWKTSWAKPVFSLFIWKSPHFLRVYGPARITLVQELEAMHRRAWAYNKHWDLNEPQYTQLPGDAQFRQGNRIPWENLNKMLHMAFWALKKQWETGYPFPSTFVDDERKIPPLEFIIRGDHAMGAQRSYFCKFLAIALADAKGKFKIDPYAQVKGLLDEHRLRKMNPGNTRINGEYIDDLVEVFRQDHLLPKNGWDFQPLEKFMRCYGITI